PTSSRACTPRQGWHTRRRNAGRDREQPEKPVPRVHILLWPTLVLRLGKEPLDRRQRGGRLPLRPRSAPHFARATPAQGRHKLTPANFQELERCVAPAYTLCASVRQHRREIQ